MLHWSIDETYNNKQVSKVFRQNFSWNMPKNEFKRCEGAVIPDPRLGSKTREYARPNTQWTCLVIQVVCNLREKRNFTFSAPHLCPKKYFRATVGTNSRCSALLRICASFSLFSSRAQGNLATELLVVNGKIKKFMLLNSVPSPTFSIVLRHCWHKQCNL